MRRLNEQLLTQYHGLAGNLGRFYVDIVRSLAPNYILMSRQQDSTPHAQRKRAAPPPPIGDCEICNARAASHGSSSRARTPAFLSHPRPYQMLTASHPNAAQVNSTWVGGDATENNGAHSETRKPPAVHNNKEQHS